MEQVMEFKITGKNMEVTDGVRESVQKKLNKLTGFLPPPAEAKVEISYEATRAADKRYTVQVTVNSKGLLIRGEERAENVQTAIDQVEQVVSRQVKRHREKQRNKSRGPSPARLPPPTTLIEPVPAETGSAIPEDIVRTKRFPVKPMSASEALDQMELLGHDFFLFLDSDTGKFSCIYKRKDGKYGLIETELA